jgi:hypothetical protein
MAASNAMHSIPFQACWRDLVGAEVELWLGVRIPFWEGPSRFAHPDFDCVQVMSLELVADCGNFDITAFESGFVEETDYLEHELVLRRFRDRRLRSPNSTDVGMQRLLLAGLPTGRVTEVKERVESNWVQEVLLTFADDRRLLLVAGQTEETWSGPLIWRRSDESVLVFLDPDDVVKVPWDPPRDVR